MGYTPLWMNDLQPASWRGLPFVVEAISHSAGRRTVIHEYPYRDKPWVEDLGVGLEEFSIRGYLNGGDVASKAKVFKQACIKAGPGELVHPRLGSLTVSLISQSFGEAKEEGNVVSFQLNFVVTQTESSITLWPKDWRNNWSIGDSVLNVNGAASGDFFSDIKDAIKTGTAAVREVTDTAQGYVNEVNKVVGDARGALGAVQGVATSLGIPASAFGRFNKVLNSAQSLVTQASSGLAMATRVENGVDHAIEGVSRARTVVSNAADKVMTLAGKL